MGKPRPSVATSWETLPHNTQCWGTAGVPTTSTLMYSGHLHSNRTNRAGQQRRCSTGYVTTSPPKLANRPIRVTGTFRSRARSLSWREKQERPMGLTKLTNETRQPGAHAVCTSPLHYHWSWGTVQKGFCVFLKSQHPGRRGKGG